MNGFVLDYINENEFRKLESSLKKYNMLAYKDLFLHVYPDIKKGNFVGDKISHNKKQGTETYSVKLRSDNTFTKVHGEVRFVYKVYTKEKVAMLQTITPEKILLEGHNSELATYKGIMISKKNAAKDMFKIDLLNFIQDKY